jgi:hypothetical protein
MKAFALLLAATLATAAFGQPVSPLIVKSSGGGLISGDWATSESCTVYADKVEISRHFGYGDGAFTTTEQRAFQIDGDIAGAIADAAAASLEATDNFLCDGPSTSVAANKIAADGTVEQVLLFATGGCGSPRQLRSGGAAYRLKALVDAFCPVTHDIVTR